MVLTHPRRILAAALAALLGGGLVLYVTGALGLAITPDSLHYLAAAKNLAAGHGLLGYDNSPFVSWPPLLPLVLAGLQTLGLEMVHGLRWLYALLDALVLAFSVLWVSRSSQDDSRDIPSWATFLFALAAVCALPQLRVATAVWSELLLIVLALIGLYAAVAYSMTSGGSAFTIAVVAVALACLSRYSAVALLFAVTSLFLLVGRVDLGRRVKRGVLFASAAGLPLVLWMLRNWNVSGTLTGPRHATIYQWSISTALLGSSIPKLFLPAKVADFVPGHVWLLLFVLLLVWIFRSSLRSVRRNPPNFRQVSRLALVLYIGWFFLILLAAFSSIGMDPPNERLWAPVVLPSLILVGLFVKRRGTRSSWIALLILAGLMISGAIRLPGRIERFQEKDAVYALPKWQHSPMVRYLHAHPLQGTVLSNQPEFVHYVLGMQVQSTPRFKNYNAKNLEIQKDEVRQFEAAVKRANGAHIVWFDETKGYLFPMAWLAKYYPFETVAEFPDGKILSLANFEGSVVPDSED
ncbi:MAG TPA: hypothetical protein VKA63_10635, partial [Candidatus Krumholzibacteria bacterium]|nr:hypothetical protein [Candidatus Krumholzibacteria bacterium]